MRKFILLATVALIMGLSLLSIHCSNPDYKLPIQGRGAGLEKQGLSLKGLQGDTIGQLKMTLKGFR